MTSRRRLRGVLLGSACAVMAIAVLAHCSSQPASPAGARSPASRPASVAAPLPAHGPSGRPLALPVEATGSLNQARQDHTASLLPDGRVLVAGGQQVSAGNPATTLASAELYDPSNGAWTSANPMTGPRQSHAAAVLADGRILVTGGSAGGTALDTAEIFDPASGNWSGTNPMSSARAGHAATLLPNGTVLVEGGFAGGTELASAELFDPSTGTWTPTGSLTTGRGRHTATLLGNGQVLVTGGADAAGTALVTAEVFDPAAGTWSSAGSMSTARAGHAATRLQNGQMLVTGGGSATAELYDPSANGWTSTGAMASARTGHTTTLLGNGQVLAAGGGPVNAGSAELYSPATGTWTRAGCLLTQRSAHTATLLGSGKVLVAGGTDGTASLATSELFDPAGGAALGTTCASDCECASGFCANGVCCNTACNGGACQACSVAAGAATDGTCEVLPPTHVCRPAADVCDTAETCDGTSAACPVDVFQPSTVICRPDGGACDLAETCTGSSAACPADVFQPSTVVCRPDAGACDIAETCTGSSAACPADSLLPAAVTCRPSAGPCDVAETCTGSSPACPANVYQPSTVVCRPDAGACDVAETCDGASPLCPADSFLPATVTCRPSAGACNVAESCSGASANCPVDAVVADGGTGAPSCAPYVCNGSAVTCPSSCASGADCASDAWCDQGACKPRQVNGSTCGVTQACLSGHCVDGVCCDTACTGACAACSTAAGAAVNGTCGPVALGSAGRGSCAPYVCDGAMQDCPTTCSDDAHCAQGLRCVAGQCVSEPDAGMPDGGAPGGSQSFVGWHCGCQGSSGDAAIWTALLGLGLLRSRRRAAHRTTARLGSLALLVSVLVSGLARASEPVGATASSRPGMDAPTVTASGPEAPLPFAPLHLSATSFLELQSQNIGAEVGASYAFSRYTDVGVSAVLGQYIGGRLVFALHPGPDWRFKPVAQLRGVFHPTPDGMALGGGAGVGAMLEAGPGRVTLLAVGEVYRGPANYLPTGLFAMLGYELDLFKPAVGAAPAREVVEARPEQPTPPAPQPEQPQTIVTVEPPPPPEKLRTDDLPPPTYTKPTVEAPKPPPVVEPEPAKPPPAAGQARVSVKLVIRDRVLFAEGKSRIRSKYLPVLKRVASILKRYDVIRKVRIDGYADDRGSDEANLRLSERRAREVMDFLVKNGVDESRLEIRAYGRMKVMMQETPKDREENRRVEFTITDPPQDEP